MYNADSSASARCLLHSLRDFELIIYLCVCRHLMFNFKRVTVALLGVESDKVNGFFIIKTMKDTLQNENLVLQL